MRLQHWMVGFSSLALIVAATAWAESHDKEKGKASGGAELKIGDAAPAFELTGSDGKTYKMADVKDKVVVLQWLSQDCPYCVKAAPLMKEAADKAVSKGVVWYGMDSKWDRTAEQANEYIKQQKFPFPILLDPDGKVGKTYGAKRTPHIYIFNKGKLAYVGASDDKKGRNYVTEALDAILAGKEPPLPTTEAYGCTVKYKKS